MSSLFSKKKKEVVDPRLELIPPIAQRHDIVRTLGDVNAALEVSLGGGPILLSRPCWWMHCC
jgi:hypothetical protein